MQYLLEAKEHVHSDLLRGFGEAPLWEGNMRCTHFNLMDATRHADAIHCAEGHLMTPRGVAASEPR